MLHYYNNIIIIIITGSEVDKAVVVCDTRLRNKSQHKVTVLFS